MSVGQLNPLLLHVRRLANGTPSESLSDDQLLARFQADREESAFTAIMRRHGRTIWGVCRRVLGHEQDAEDAFQATFLVLARKAGSIRHSEAVGAWLHGAAYRIAMRAKRDAAIRRRHEMTAPGAAHSGSVSSAISLREGMAILDDEVQRLGVKHRAVFVACCLEGKTMAEAARELGWKEGTVSGTLARAKARLRVRLARRDVTLSAVLTALALTEPAEAAVSVNLIATTLRAAVRYAAGGPAPAALLNLIRAAGRAAMLTRVKTAPVLLALAGVAAACGLASAPSSGEEAKPLRAPVNASQQARADEIVEVSGRVLDPEGKPVRGAKLYLPRWLKERPATQDDVELVQRGTTDEEGQFRAKLPAKEARPGRPVALVAAAEGFGIDWADLVQDGKQGELTFRLVKDVPIRGRLITTEGKPIPNVAVHVIGVMVPGKFDDFLKAYQRGLRHLDEGTGTRKLAVALAKVLRVTASDKDGKFEVKGAGSGRLVALEVRNGELAETTIPVVTREGLDIETINKAILQTLGGRRENVPPLLHAPNFEFALEPARAIEGAVREAGNGKPVAGATVQALGVTALTDAQGRYRLAGMRKAEKYVISVASPKDLPLLGRLAEVTSPPGLAPAKLDLELARGNFVTGRVYDKVTGNGVESHVRFAPLPENANELARSPLLTLHTSTDAEGRFRLVTISGPGVLAAQVPGTFLKIDGVPIYPYKAAEFSAEDRKRVKMTDDLRPYRAFVTAVGAETLDVLNACRVLDVKEGGDAVTCDLAVDPGKTMKVNLQDPDGKPLAGAWAAGVSAMTLRAVPLKNAVCPVYALDPESPRELVFLHLERKLAAVAMVRGDEKEPVTVRLLPTSVVTGRLLDADGQPVAEADVHTLYKGPVGQKLTRQFEHASQPPRTDEEGRFRLEGIVPGLQLDLGIVKGRQRLHPDPRLAVTASGSDKRLDMGEIRVKPRRQ